MQNAFRFHVHVHQGDGIAAAHAAARIDIDVADRPVVVEIQHTPLEDVDVVCGCGPVYDEIASLIQGYVLRITVHLQEQIAVVAV